MRTPNTQYNIPQEVADMVYAEYVKLPSNTGKVPEQGIGIKAAIFLATPAGMRLLGKVQDFPWAENTRLIFGVRYAFEK